MRKTSQIPAVHAYYSADACQSAQASIFSKEGPKPAASEAAVAPNQLGEAALSAVCKIHGATLLPLFMDLPNPILYTIVYQGQQQVQAWASQA